MGKDPKDRWIDELVEMREKGMSGEEIIRYIQENTKVELFVYFILNRDHNAVKIGMSHDPKERIKHLQKFMLDELEFLGCISCGENARKVEKELHRIFESSHIKGEWFKYELFVKESVRKLLGKVKEES